MNEYETVCVLKPDLPGARVEKLNEKIQKILSQSKASLINQKDWGKRKLAYRVGKFTFGQYLYFNYSGGGEFIRDLERTLKYEEEVLRYLTVQIPKNALTSPTGKSKKVLQPEEAHFSMEDTRPMEREGSWHHRED